MCDATTGKAHDVPAPWLKEWHTTNKQMSQHLPSRLLSAKPVSEPLPSVAREPACKWRPYRPSPIPDHRISSTSFIPSSVPLKALNCFLSLVCICQHIFWLVNPWALGIKQSSCPRISHFFSLVLPKDWCLMETITGKYHWTLECVVCRCKQVLLPHYNKNMYWNITSRSKIMFCFVFFTFSWCLSCWLRSSGI